jgi:hypothetical protein
MAKFMFVYQGGGGMAETPSEQEKMMAAWGAWYGTLGESVADGGAPFAGSTSVSPKGRSAAATALTGFSMVNAPSLEAAAAMTKGCPVLTNGGTVDVYECIDMGM